MAKRPLSIKNKGIKHMASAREVAREDLVCVLRVETTWAEDTQYAVARASVHEGNANGPPVPIDVIYVQITAPTVYPADPVLGRRRHDAVVHHSWPLAENAQPAIVRAHATFSGQRLDGDIEMDASTDDGAIVSAKPLVAMKTVPMALGVTLTAVQTFQLNESEVASLQQAVAPPAVMTLDKTYWVMLINTSSICITRARTRPVGSSTWGGFFATQRICHNCDNSYDECYKRQQWAPVMSTNCDSGAFELMIIDDPDPNGNARGGVYTINPNCRSAGGIIGLG
jgi:hypothetical protein